MQLRWNKVRKDWIWLDSDSWHFQLSRVATSVPLKLISKCCQTIRDTEICHVNGSVYHKEHEIAGNNGISDKNKSFILKTEEMCWMWPTLCRSRTLADADASLQSWYESTTQPRSNCV